MQSLPVELLSQILVHGAECLSRLELSYESLLSYRLAVTSVCEHWRGVAVRTPLLWTHILIPYSLPAKIDGAVALLKLGLERSSTAPIEINFSNADHVAELWAILAPHLMRCSRLTIHSYRLFYSLVGPLPSLRCLDVDSSSVRLSSALAQLELSPADTPSLREMKLRGANAALLIHVDTSILTRLSIHETLRGTFFLPTFMGQCTSLTHLDISLPFYEPIDNQGEGEFPVFLPNLQYLGTDEPRLLQYLAMPNLRYFYAYDDCFGASHSDPGTLASLEVLTINYVGENAMKGSEVMISPALRDAHTLELVYFLGTVPILTSLASPSEPDTPTRPVISINPLLPVFGPPTNSSARSTSASSCVPFSLPSLRLLRLGFSVASKDISQYCSMLLRVLDAIPELHLECDMEMSEDEDVQTMMRPYRSRIRQLRRPLVGPSLRW